MPASLPGLSLLVVEDDADSRLLMEILLSRLGASVRVASTAAEAWSAIEAQAPHAIVMDISLPDQDGFAFVTQLRNNPATTDIPAIALTGHTGPTSRNRALSAGFQGYVTKPVEIAALVGAITSVVRVAIDGGDPHTPAQG